MKSIFRTVTLTAAFASAAAMADTSRTIGQGDALRTVGGNVRVYVKDTDKLIVDFTNVVSADQVTVVGINGKGIDYFVPIVMVPTGADSFGNPTKGLQFQLPDEIIAKEGRPYGYNKVILKVSRGGGAPIEHVAVRFEANRYYDFWTGRYINGKSATARDTER